MYDLCFSCGFFVIFPIFTVLLLLAVWTSWEMWLQADYWVITVRFESCVEGRAIRGQWMRRFVEERRLSQAG
jgi:Na+(H+)/acetate symporter ActP